MAARRPASAHSDKGGMIDVADVKLANCARGGVLQLRVAAQTKIDVPLDQQFLIN